MPKIKSSSSKTYQSIQQEDTIVKEELASFFKDDEFKWTQEEEKEVLEIIDKYLMVFILLMTFVLNMDRTNICK
jgi:hypothetical protein